MEKPPGIRGLFILLISVASIFSFGQVPLPAGGLTGGSGRMGELCTDAGGCMKHPRASVSLISPEDFKISLTKSLMIPMNLELLLLVQVHV